MDKEMLAMVTFKEGTFDKFMGWFQSEEGLEIRKTIAHVEQTRPGFAPDKSYAMMKVTVHNEENMKKYLALLILAGMCNVRPRISSPPKRWNRLYAPLYRRG